MISIFQIYFDEKSKQHLDPAFHPYLNNTKDDYFENSVIAQMHKLEGADYLGVTSWKQQLKTHLTGKEILDFIQKDIDTGTEKDVYIYSPIQGIEPKRDHLPPYFSASIRFPDIWNMQWHKTPKVENSNIMLNRSGVLPFDLFDGKWQYCHCNYWIAKRHIFDEYCEKVLLPAIAFFERPEIKAAMPKWYIHSHEGRKCNSCCFTLEGLFGSFLAHTNYSFEYICKKKIKRKYEMIKINGYEIINN